MNEIEVILKTHKFLQSRAFGQQNVVRLYTDTHNTLLPYTSLAPFQRFTVDMGDFVMHPDLVGQLSDGESLFAIEAKGDSDLVKGLAQAEMYQIGFHYVFLAADAKVLGNSLLSFAKRKNIGVIAVSDAVTIAHLPEAQMPLRDASKFVALQMESVIQIWQRPAFHFNVPTHYLVWAIALQPRLAYSLKSVRDELANYPMPKEWRSALAVAQWFGLVRILGDEVQLTVVGNAVKEILPASIDEWTQVHKIIGARGQSIPLVQYQPRAAAILRLLLLQDPIVRLVIEGLQMFSDGSASFNDLAIACDQLDHARAPIFFLNPEAVAQLMDDKGKIRWQSAKSQHYRSSTFYQYKSVLRHAGVLRFTKLGGGSTKTYNPSEDIWALP